MVRFLLVWLCSTFLLSSVLANTWRVPQDHKTIQAAIDAAKANDVIVIAPGKYNERLRLQPGLTLRSAGDDAKGVMGLKRAEATVLDGSGKVGKEPGIVLAEGCHLDGVTVTNVGVYDEARWKKHFDTQGEELDDEEGATHAEGTIPAISIPGVNCTVTHCIVHHNGDVGIAILGRKQASTAPLISANITYRNMGGGIGIAEGAEPTVRGNICKENLRAGIGCRQASPLLLENVCSGNVRAGIGCREGAKPVLRRNVCFQNRRAGIGIRMEGTAPLVENNECYENEMAGIGSRDGASPILRNNLCRKNKLAGIGCRDGAKPFIVGNTCQENELAGIGVQKATAIIHENKCVDNKLVAIGVIGASTATITNNELSRQGGQPPLIAIKEGSTATLQGNRLSGGGVAGILVEGQATIRQNTFTANHEKQGTAVWVWEKSQAYIEDNSITGYRTAVNANKANVSVVRNTITGFQGTAIIVKESPKPAHVQGNSASSADPKAKVVEVQGKSGIVEENVLKREEPTK